MRRGRAIIETVRRLAVLATIALVASGAAAAGQRALPRATTDRPDDVQGPQLHVIYAVPRDGEDRGLDTSGTIATSIAAIQEWLAAETGGRRLVLDTFGGELDVTFARLDRTDAEISARGPFVRDELEALLQSAGVLRPTKIYAVYYDGGSTHACGGGAWPPTLPGRVAALYLRGTPPGAPPCSQNPFGAPGAAGYVEFSMLHEVLHTIGFVAECAPHHTLAGHASDSPNDLMWAGDAPWQLPPRLDIGRDDYFGHGRSDCADLARSDLLTSSTPPPTPPELEATSLSLGVPRAGRVLEARLAVRLDGERPEAGTTECKASVRGRSLAPVLQTFLPGEAVCRWQIPRHARRARLRGRVTATVGTQTVGWSFVRLVRDGRR
jgi:hypothetical protein